jgi:IS5 family transposase
MSINITALYCCLDDFCKVFEEWERHRLIPSEKKRCREGKLSLSEMLFIMVLFHLSPFRHFKAFYCYGVGQQYRGCFDEIPHYDRFVSLMPRLFAPLMVLLHCLSGEETGIYFADSTKLAVCHNRRISRHLVFDGLAARGRTSMGWFYGLKLHFVINHKGEIMALKITPGNTADSAVLNDITKRLTGKLYADKGYLGKELFKQLWQRGLHVITGIRRNMKNYLLPIADKIMLRKRFLIETVLDTLKSEMGLEHSRHRSPVNAMVHVLSCLAAYAFRPGKPTIPMIDKQLEAYA